eukprot:7375100-Lingulodinium_polyedra.AAC.1
MVLLDEGTDYVRVAALQAHDPEALYRAVEAHWIDWVGPPDVFSADGERGCSPTSVGAATGRAGSLYTPSAA